MQLELAKIRLDGGTQPRAELSEGTILEYMADMRKGDVFRRITVVFDGEHYWLVDGYHRVEAKRRLGPDGFIEADVEQGTLADAQWHSYSVNKTHGMRRTNEDKKRAVRAAVAHPQARLLSNRQVADHCGVDEKMVRRYRSKMETTSAMPQSNHDRPSATLNLATSIDSESTSAGTPQLDGQPCSADQSSGLHSAATDVSRPRTGRDGRTINTAKIGRSHRRRRPIPRSPAEFVQARREGYRVRLTSLVKLELPNNNVHNCAFDLLRYFTFEYLQKVFAEIVNIHQQQSQKEAS